MDTGATYSCINKELYDKLYEKKYVMGELPVSNLKLIGAAGRRLITVTKQTMIEMCWCQRKYGIIVLVVDKLFSSLFLGLDWLRGNNIIIKWGEDVVIEAETCRDVTENGIMGRKEREIEGQGGECDLDIQYGKGEENVAADVLSRVKRDDGLRKEEGKFVVSTELMRKPDDLMDRRFSSAGGKAQIASIGILQEWIVGEDQWEITGNEEKVMEKVTMRWNVKHLARMKRRNG